jgi:hypothetical protein
VSLYIVLLDKLLFVMAGVIFIQIKAGKLAVVGKYLTACTPEPEANVN